MDFADKVIKEQIVNILAVLSDDFSQTYLFENVLISGQSPDTVIELPEHIRNDVKAYVLNYNELAYGIFYPDQKSIDFFERNLRHTNSAMLQLTVL